MADDTREWHQLLLWGGKEPVSVTNPTPTDTDSPPEVLEDGEPIDLAATPNNASNLLLPLTQ